MRTWVIALAVLVVFVTFGGCSSTSSQSMLAFAPGADMPVSDAHSTSALGWGSPIVLDDQSPQHDVGKSLAIIAGNPAVSYLVWSDQGQTKGFTLYYQRANDSAGTSWGTAKALASWYDPGPYTVSTSLLEVNGKPAISYMGKPEAWPNTLSGWNLSYIRAKDPIGRNWGTRVIVDPSEGTMIHKGMGATMKVVNGNPAIWYREGSADGKYVRALDQNGNSWGAPVYPGLFGGRGTFEFVNGHPAVILGNGANGELRYLRADDANGDNWGSPLTVLTDPGPAGQRRLTVANGCPAIAFSGNKATYPGSGVRFIRSLDADGATWPSAAIDVTVSSNSSNDWLGWVADVNGLPSIAFVRGFNVAENPSPPAYDDSYLSFVQATDPDGSAWETAQTIVSLGGVRSDPVMAEMGSGAGITYLDNWHIMNFVGTVPAPPSPAVNVQLSTDKSSYIIGQDTQAVLTAVVTDEYGDPISGLDSTAFATTLDSLGVTVTFGESTTAGTYTGTLDVSALTTGDHTVQTTVTDTRDISGSGSATFSMNEPGAGGTMHVGDLDASADPGPHGWWRASFTVKIDDSNHNPVSGADVSFSFSGADSGSGQVTTGGDGTASYQTGWIKSSGSVTFTVDDVAHATLNYSAGDNHDPDGDSDGTSITVSAP